MPRSHEFENPSYPSEGSLTQEQMAAILYAISLGRQLQIDHPQIATYYKSGMSQPKIIEKLKLDEEYGTSEAVMNRAIQLALKGFSSELADVLGLEPYEGIVDPQVYKEAHDKITLKARSDTGRWLGRKTHEEGTGIFGMSPEKKIASVRKGGLHTKGSLQFQSVEKRKEIALKSVLDRGLTPWATEELELAYTLSQDPDYQRRNLLQRVTPNYELIAENLNRMYHDGKQVRIPRSVKQALYRLKK
ncbi:hypothetical protein HY008_00780 [Candidatus Woesebacteria bacterium]|nr:hypothetical protein [Candidatus Woesebacteria bacterium]